MASIIKIGGNTEVNEEIIKRCCSLAMEAHNSPENIPGVVPSSDAVYFSFPGSWSADEWFSRRGPFGEVEVDLQLFPSLKCVGLDEKAKLNEAYLLRFKAVLGQPQFKNQLAKAVAERKRVVFTGHSSGGPIAILSTIWYLEESMRAASYGEFPPLEPLCVTFGSPLVGDFIVNFALGRQNWSQFFLHFVNKHDIVPRISLTPLSSIQHCLQTILNHLNPSRSLYRQETLFEAVGFYKAVMQNTLSVASSAACKTMGSTNPLLETLFGFIEISPYRPFGTYVFCTGNRNYVATSNSDAVLQLLFYSSLLDSAEEERVVAQRSLNDHLSYKDELQGSLQFQSVTYLDRRNLEIHPFAEAEKINAALNDLGVSDEGRLCLLAAEEMERQKLRNQNMIDKKKKDIKEQLDKLERYKHNWEVRGVSCVEAFKKSNEQCDFHANIGRLELAGTWDELIEMFKKYELPSGFEGQQEWIDLATRYRRIVEPLDIANYYRHLKNEDTGPYMGRGRPKRYKCAQKWLEHALSIPSEASPGSCFWAEVEELCIKAEEPGNRDEFENVLATKVPQWIQEGELGNDVYLENSMFTKLRGR